jgi:hypothetical protein
VSVSAKRIFQIVIVTAAVAVAIAPPGAVWVERWYAKWFYPMLQSSLTSLSNRSPIALFDVAIVTFVLIAIGIWAWSISLSRRKQRWRSLGRGAAATLTLLALVYLWFLAAWGLNYARPSLESQIGFDESRITPAAVRALADHAVRRANQTYAAGHAASFPAITAAPERLVTALHQVEREFGRPRPTVIAKPKWSLFTPFYRASGVSGQLGPFFLETLLNPDLTGPERPAVLAHEWAHLSGYAPESEASFIGLLAALRAGPAAEYSVWLDLVAEAANQLQPVTQRLVLEKLEPGPREDQAAIRERLKQLVRPVQRATWSTYDQMLKSQGVDEGVRSYSRVIQLLIGSDVLKIPPSRLQPASQ